MSTLRWFLVGGFAVAASCAAAQQAPEYTEPGAGFVSTKDRAEVRQEIVKAQQDGTLMMHDGQDPPAFVSSQTTDEVKRDQAQSHAAHRIDRPGDLYFGS